MASFKRASSFGCTFYPPKNPTEYSAIIVTVAQDGVNLVNKTLADLQIDGGGVIVTLSQQETALFTAGKRAWIQMRCFISDTEVPASDEYPIDVLPVLDDQMLAAPEE